MFVQTTIKSLMLPAFAAITLLVPFSPAGAAPAAKQLFSAKKLPAVMKPAVHGFYNKGCVQGAIAIPNYGDTWQAMRPKRNRRWGHPDLIKLIVKLSQDAKKFGWNGLLVGDMSQPRGGPSSGHASHQLGLDADIWLTPMPNRQLSNKERNNMSATSMLRYSRNKSGKRFLDQNNLNRKVFSRKQFGVIKTTAKYKQVERVLVHPTIKRELCRLEKGDRRWLSKVRPYWGHYFHMHVRLSCPAGSPNCRPQAKPKNSDGCGAELKTWAKLLNPPPRKPRKKGAPKPRKAKLKRELRLNDLPRVCSAVLRAPGPQNALAATLKVSGGNAYVPTAKAIPAAAAANQAIINKIPLPTFRP